MNTVLIHTVELCYHFHKQYLKQAERPSGLIMLFILEGAEVLLDQQSQGDLWNSDVTVISRVCKI